MQNLPGKCEGEKRAADTGNASNPTSTEFQNENANQLLDKKAEKYLREAGNIEDMPDDEDQQEMDQTLDGNKE